MDTLLSPRRRRFIGAATALGTLALTGCSDSLHSGRATATGQRLSGQTMGTAYTLRLAGSALPGAALERLHADLQSVLDGVDQRMSLYRPESELVRLNQHHSQAPLRLSADLFTVLQAGRQVAEMTAGAFDVSVAPLVVSWGFGPLSRRAIPGASELHAGREVLGYRSLELDTQARTAIKRVPGLQADLGGIAKGYGVDLAAQLLLARGLQNFMLEAGGEVRAEGRNTQGQPWRIGIEEPDASPQRARLVVPLSGLAMATSGDYRNYFEQGGRRYSHEIDPGSGEPINHSLCSVSVVAGDCMQADALATALIVMGPERGMALAQRLRIATHFILRGADGSLHDRSSDAFAALRTTSTA